MRWSDSLESNNNLITKSDLIWLYSIKKPGDLIAYSSNWIEVCIQSIALIGNLIDMFQHVRVT